MRPSKTMMLNEMICKRRQTRKELVTWVVFLKSFKIPTLPPRGREVIRRSEYKEEINFLMLYFP